MVACVVWFNFRVFMMHEVKSRGYRDSSRFLFLRARLLSPDEEASEPLLLDEVAMAARWAASKRA